MGLTFLFCFIVKKHVSSLSAQGVIYVQHEFCNKPFVVASCSTTFGLFNKRPVERLEAAGCVVKLNETGVPLAGKDFINFIDGANAVILGNDKLERAQLSKVGDDLRLIVRYGAGLDGIDFALAEERGIKITNTPGANSEETADLSFALMLDLARKVTQSSTDLKAGIWKKQCGQSLYGKKLGIIGVGRIGMAVARRAMGFGLDIIGNDILEKPEAARFGLMYVSLNDLIEQSDIISIHAPLTSATKGLFGAKEFRRMKSNCLLINTARADIIRQTALLKALEEGQIAGYATDVYESDPPKDMRLLERPNVIATPHIGSTTKEANLRMGEMVVDNILAYLAGMDLPNAVTAIDRVLYS